MPRPLHPRLTSLLARMQVPSPVRQHTIQVGASPPQRIWVKHEEAIHPEVAGNKWRKLALHLHLALEQNAAGLATYGGAYSQHLLATAWCAKELCLPAKGYMRGEVPTVLNPLLAKCRALGMALLPSARTGFVEAALAAEGLDVDGMYHIPLGGASPVSAEYYGQSLWTELEPVIEAEGVDQIWLSAGTGTSAAGLWLAMAGRVQLHVVPAYKTTNLFWHEMGRLTKVRLTKPDHSFVLEENLPYTRFGRLNPAMQQVANAVHAQTGLSLEPVYEQRLFAEALTNPGGLKLVVHNGF